MELLTNLMPHQVEAVEKLSKIKIGALYMEQGTGKTRTTLDLIKRRLDRDKVDSVLWLCPCSVKRNLREDITYHCGMFPDNIVIRGIESLSSSDRLYLQLLRLVEEHQVMLVVDESNLVKNCDAIRTARITEISKHCTYKIILNGTPVSKNEADLFAQWYILDWRILGYQSYYSFSANHLEYWKIQLPDGREIIDHNRIKRVLHVDYLTEKIAPYTYQVKKSECLKLPGKNYRRITYETEMNQYGEYLNVKDIYLARVDEIKPDTIYKLFTALQHVLSGRHVLSSPSERMVTSPMFTNPANNPRIIALMDTLEDLKEEKCIIFCKYQSEINDIMKILEERGKTAVMFTGKVSQKQRQVNRDRFRNEVQYLLANKMCGAYGLNLQFCHNIIYYNNDFDLATRLQSEDRVHRIGQDEDVFIYDIYCPGTIDEFIIDCLSRKENLVEAFKNEINKLKGVKSWKKYTQIKQCTKQRKSG